MVWAPNLLKRARQRQTAPRRPAAGLEWLFAVDSGASVLLHPPRDGRGAHRAHCVWSPVELSSQNPLDWLTSSGPKCRQFPTNSKVV